MRGFALRRGGRRVPGRLAISAALRVIGCLALGGGASVSGAALAGCAAPITPVRLEAPEGYAISFPAATEGAAGRDGPVRFRIDAMRTPDEARFEAAWFGFHQALDAPERQELLDRVERGLAAGGAKVSRRAETPPGNKDRVDLVLDHPDGRRGYHRILYPTPKSMLQVSVVGPRGGDWEKLVAGFFASLNVKKTEPLDTAPVSAGLAPPGASARPVDVPLPGDRAAAAPVEGDFEYR